MNDIFDMDFIHAMFDEKPKVVEIKEEFEYLFERLKNKYEELMDVIMNSKNDENCCVIDMPI